MCKCKLLTGEVDHDPYLPDALTDAERDGGFILACRARPRGDVGIEVEQLDSTDELAAFAVTRLQATVVSIDSASHGVTQLRLTTNKPMIFSAGQYASLTFDKQFTRSYSMANCLDETDLEFHIGHIPDGVTSGYVANQLSVGEIIDIEGPFGSSYLRESHAGPLLLIAGGTGLAPIWSILRTVLAKMPEQHVHVYFGVGDANNIYLEDELHAIAASNPRVSMNIVVSSSTPNEMRRNGFLHEVIKEDFSDLTGFKVYAAGSPPMIDALKQVVLPLGLAASDFHTDPFTPSVPDNKARPEAGLLRGAIAKLFRRPKSHVGYATLDHDCFAACRASCT